MNQIQSPFSMAKRRYFKGCMNGPPCSKKEHVQCEAVVIASASTKSIPYFVELYERLLAVP